MGCETYERRTLSLGGAGAELETESTLPTGISLHDHVGEARWPPVPITPARARNCSFLPIEPNPWASPSESAQPLRSAQHIPAHRVHTPVRRLTPAARTHLTASQPN